VKKNDDDDFYIHFDEHTGPTFEGPSRRGNGDARRGKYDLVVQRIVNLHVEDGWVALEFPPKFRVALMRATVKDRLVALGDWENVKVVTRTPYLWIRRITPRKDVA